MFDRPASILKLEIDARRRILAISDIHANIPYLEGVLKKADFSDKDELFLLGDFLEKGEDSLGTLRYVMRLASRGNTHAICGNCDDWRDIYHPLWKDERDEGALRYMQWRKGGLLWEMCLEAGIEPMGVTNFTKAKAQLREAFSSEWVFLEAMPHAIETEKFVFSHSGMRADKALHEHSVKELIRCDSFMTRGWSFDKWVVVGHWPVVLYGANRVCANPIIDREKKIISIDGGCVLKDDGQLNALIIPDKHSEDFDFVAYDPFEEKTVINDQAEGGESYYIRWGDSNVQVLQRGEEFSRCMHVRTGYKMDILTKYLFTDNEYTDCNDCTDYVLPLKAGDKVKLIEKTSRGYFVKHDGSSGWYYGGLK